MSAFKYRFWNIGITYKGVGGIGGWNHLFWRVWIKDREYWRLINERDERHRKANEMMREYFNEQSN